MLDHRIRSFANLQAEVERTEQTIADLQKNGHPCPDAERQLKEMQDKLLQSSLKPRER